MMVFRKSLDYWRLNTKVIIIKIMSLLIILIDRIVTRGKRTFVTFVTININANINANLFMMIEFNLNAATQKSDHSVI
jgi:hypothetical protein